MSNTLEQLKLNDATTRDIENLSTKSCNDLSNAIDEYTIHYCRIFSKCLQLIQSDNKEDLIQGIDLMLSLFDESSSNKSFFVTFIQQAIEKRLSLGDWEEIIEIEQLIINIKDQGIELHVQPYKDNNQASLDITVSSNDDLSSKIALLGERQIQEIRFDNSWANRSSPVWLREILIKSAYQSYSSVDFHTDFYDVPDSFNIENLKLDVIINHSNAASFTKLDLNNLSKIPPEISNLTNLEELEIRGTFTSLPKSIGSLSKLQKLICRYSGLLSLPDELGNCSQLQRLDIENTSITAIPSSLLQNSQLRLDMDYTPAQEESIIWEIQDGYLEISTESTCSHEKISSSLLAFLKNNKAISKTITKAPIEAFCVQGMEIVKLLPKLNSLYSGLSSYSRYSSASRRKENLKTVRSLTFEDDMLKLFSTINKKTLTWKFEILSIPTSILLQRLETTKDFTITKKKKVWSDTLNFTNTELKECPSILKEYIDLCIDLQGNKFKELPTYFKKLILSTNLLKILCKNAADFKKLTYLDLTNCQISDTYKGFGNLPALQEVQFTSNRLRTIPKDLIKIKTLKTLKMSGCRVSLPEWIGELNQVKHMDFSGNWGQTSLIPSGIGLLTKLETLDISGGRITELPSVLGKLVSLKKLILTGNNIVSMNMNLKNMKSLKILSFNVKTKKQIPNIEKTLQALSKNKKLKIYIDTRYENSFDTKLNIIFDSYWED